MQPETKTLLKKTFPSHFLPRLLNPEQKAIRKEITNRIFSINSGSNNLTPEKFEEFQKGLSKLHKTAYDKNTSTLISAIYWDIAVIDDVKECLYAIDTNRELLRSIINNAVGLLYSFKKSEYRRLINELYILKQRTK